MIFVPAEFKAVAADEFISGFESGRPEFAACASRVRARFLAIYGKRRAKASGRVSSEQTSSGPTSADSATATVAAERYLSAR